MMVSMYDPIDLVSLDKKHLKKSWEHVTTKTTFRWDKKKNPYIHM
jgi:hypothetical protein